MNDAIIQAVVAELEPLLVGRRFGKVFQLSPESFAIDFGLRDPGYLFISVEPTLPRVYLIKRRPRDLEKQSTVAGQFTLLLRRELSQAVLTAIEKDPNDRILHLTFSARDELDRELEKTLVVQLTGRAANILVLNHEGVITAQARSGRGRGQSIGEKYQPPPTQSGRGAFDVANLDATGRASVSEALDAQFAAAAAEHAFQSRAATARAALRKTISRQQKLIERLEADLVSHSNFEEHKRVGDLLLANIGSEKRSGDRVTVVDYFADGAPEIEIELDEKLSLVEAASRRFAEFSRSKRALRQIASRIEGAKSELARLKGEEAKLEAAIANRDEAVVGATSTSAQPLEPAGATKRAKNRIPGVRQYLSSDGFAILVGRAAHDNDHLTFKVARPNDLWLHAADYPGSHVVVRNPTRQDIPHQTVIEAAELAAFFSQAQKDPKVEVHYTSRKFLAKPKGSAPGLVRLSRQKTIVVEPKEVLNRINK